MRLLVSRIPFECAAAVLGSKNLLKDVPGYGTGAGGDSVIRFGLFPAVNCNDELGPGTRFDMRTATAGYNEAQQRLRGPQGLDVTVSTSGWVDNLGFNESGDNAVGQGGASFA